MLTTAITTATATTPHVTPRHPHPHPLQRLNHHSVQAGRALPAAAGPSSTASNLTISLQRYDDCELLWLEYRARLSVSKEAALWVLQDVQRGRLPCDAEVLRERARAFAALGQQQVVPGLDALRVLNSSRHALRHEPSHVQGSLGRMLVLLPGRHRPTQLLLNTLADLDLPPEVLALQQQELDATFRGALGCQATPRVYHHLMQRWRRQQAQKQQAKQQQPAASDDSSTPPELSAQLQALQQLLGRELVAAAVEAAPALLDAHPSRPQAVLQWLQLQLQLSPVAALLLAEAAGELLLLPVSVVEGRYTNVCYLVQQLLGWRLQQVHTLLCNHPRLLLQPSARLAASWQRVQQLARRRAAWLEELANAGQGLVAAVLGARQRQLQQLRYAADAQELRGRGLGQVLALSYADFLVACPGFRVWRGMLPAEPRRWSLVDDDDDGGEEAGPCVVVVSTQEEADAAAAAAAGHQRGQVLAVDRRGQPVLIQVAPLGPHDRLVG